MLAQTDLYFLVHSEEFIPKDCLENSYTGKLENAENVAVRELLPPQNSYLILNNVKNSVICKAQGFGMNVQSGPNVQIPNSVENTYFGSVTLSGLLNI